MQKTYARSRRIKHTLKARITRAWKQSSIRPLILLPLLVFLVTKTQGIVGAQVLAPTDNIVYVDRVVEVIREVEVDRTFKSEKQQIMAYIVQVFGEDAPDAIQIAKCESGLNPETIGDTNLMSHNNGELVGDSIGIFQVRTGGEGWNRAKANGMSAEEFRVYLKDYKKNIDYAKTIFDQEGWSPWYNCMNKVL